MARLPTVGADTNNWGTVLNEFLQIEHNIDGSIKHKNIKNVKNYGALGDDSTNDTAAFNSALSDITTDGGTIYVPKGTYRVDFTLSSKTNIRIIGDGFESIIKPYTLTQHVVSLLGCTNISIESLKIEGRYSEGCTASPLYIDIVNGLNVRKCYFNNSYMRAVDFHAYYAEPINKNVIIDGCVFKNNHRDPIYIGSAENVWVKNNLIHDAPDTAIDIGEYIYKIIVENNIVLSCQNGLYFADLIEDASCFAIGNIVLNVTGNGMHIIKFEFNGDPEGLGPTAKNWIVKNNIFASALGVGGSGIASDCQKGIIEGNLFYGFGSHVIRVETGNLLITGNTFENPYSGYCIYCTDSDVTVTNNFFKLGAGYGGGIYSNKNNLVVKNNTFIEPDSVVRLQSSNNSVVTNNVARGAVSCVSLVDSSYTTVKENNFYNSLYNTDIVETGTSNYNVITGNKVRNKYSIVKIGANTIVKRNNVFLTENVGTATITSALTAISVTHNLGITPSLNNIILTPTNNLGNSTKYWISTPTTNQFTINVDVAPGATTATFAWAIF